MVELDEVNRKLDDMLSREDYFEERYRKTKKRNKKISQYGWIMMGVLLVAASFAVGYIFGFDAGKQQVITDMTQKALQHAWGVPTW